MTKKFNIGVIGLGLIGIKRIESFIGDQDTNLIIVCDKDERKAIKTARKYKCKYTSSWENIIESDEINVVIIATPNFMLYPISKKSLSKNLHTLIEKPMGCSLNESKKINNFAKKSSSIFKIGFNHRYHPAISDAFKIFKAGEIGEIINLRAVYGHGGRPGYEKEWRGKKKFAGGGELTDQGVHLTDLIFLFCGLPKEVFCLTQTAVWPIKPLEDNAFALFKFNNKIASFHTSWTQWKNFFSFDIFGEHGSLSIKGLGGSYGTETLTKYIRNKSGGVPKTYHKKYYGKDNSWRKEWIDFKAACNGKKSKLFASEDDGLASMRMIDALYKSSEKKSLIKM